MTYRQVQQVLRQKQGYHQHELKQDRYSSMNSARLFRLEDLRSQPPEYGHELKFYTSGPFYVKGIAKGYIRQSNSITNVLEDPTNSVLCEYYINSSGLNLIYLPNSLDLQDQAEQYHDEILDVCKGSQSRHYQQMISRYENQLYEQYQCRAIVSGCFQCWNNVADHDSDLIVSDLEKIWLLTIANDQKNARGTFYYQNKKPPYRSAYYGG